MFIKYESNNDKMCLFIKIKCNGTRNFRVYAEDYGKKNSKYAVRDIIVQGEREIYFSFPVSPKTLLIGCNDISRPNSKDFEVTVTRGDLRKYDVWLDQSVRDFLDLAIYFSQVAGFRPATASGTLFETSDKKYSIKYFDIIRDVMTGKPMSTPARIGHRTGAIEASKMKFDPYTIPMRVMILLHEFSHKFKNPKIGLEISNEFGADINGLYIYLGLGFSKIDAICVFAKVFLKAQTPGNIARMRKINDYIKKFENQEFAKLTHYEK
jgi:hypothetical protein